MSTNVIPFTKMHGLGNDYVYIDVTAHPVSNPSALAKIVADRHTGIGSDGLILICPSDSADVRMEMYNADGSRAQMCGNGIRCVARYAVDHGLATGPEVVIDTDDGTKSATCEASGLVRVSMGVPELDPASIPFVPAGGMQAGAGEGSSILAGGPDSCSSGEKILDFPLTVGDMTFRITCVSMGNPHAVVFVDDLEGFPFHRVGPMMERAPAFPERVNAHFVRVETRDHLIVKTWERGSGPTRACGTGACAVVVAGVLNGLCDRRVTTTLPGGDLHIDWQESGEVFMTGPAVEVFRGEWPVG